MRRDGIEPALPPNHAEYLTDWLFEIGPVVPAGMGTARIGWSDIAAWSQLSGIEPQPWEAKILRSLSGDYLAMSQDAKDTGCPAPYETAASIAVNRAAIAVRGREAAEARARAREARQNP